MLSPDRLRELLRTRRILPRQRSRNEWDRRRRQGNHLRRQQRLALGTGARAGLILDRVRGAGRVRGRATSPLRLRADRDSGSPDAIVRHAGRGVGLWTHQQVGAFIGGRVPFFIICVRSFTRCAHGLVRALLPENAGLIFQLRRNGRFLRDAGATFSGAQLTFQRSCAPRFSRCRPFGCSVESQIFSSRNPAVSTFVAVCSVVCQLAVKVSSEALSAGTVMW